MSDGSMMTVVVCERYGAPEVLDLRRVPVPEPAPGEIRVRVRSATVNRTDTATLRAHPFFARAMTGWLKPKFFILGLDFAGEVDRVGAGVSRFAEGDRVFGMSPERYGAHAQYLCVPALGPVAGIPDGMPFEQTVVCEGAWYANATTSALTTGQAILVYGASGAIGTAAVQLAKARGVKVTAVVGTRHLGLARDLGADEIVDYTARDFTDTPERFDVVFDAVGKLSYFQCRRLLKPGGTYVATDLGRYWSNIWLGLWSALTRRRRVRIPFPVDAEGFVRDMQRLLETGQFRGVFDRSYPLDQIVEAFRFVETGEKTGIVRLEAI